MPNPAVDIDISAADSLEQETLDRYYAHTVVQSTMLATLNYIDMRIINGLTLPYFADSTELWDTKPKALELYITDLEEGRALNLEARGKDYATNILSYPSDMPASIVALMPTLPIGELIICHEVIAREASEQNKSVEQHVIHLLIHGMLHLLGFDHELGLAEQNEMEGFEIDILAELNLPNPYI